MSIPAPQPDHRKSSKARKFFIVAGVIFAILVIASIVSDGDEGATTTTAPDSAATAEKAADESKAEPKAEKLPGIGDQAKDGKFTFVVTKVEKGPKTIGNEFLNTKAQGVFWLINVEVTNHGNEPQLFTDDNQYLLVGGTKYSADSEAGIYLEGNEEVWLEEINPGNTVKGTLVFDLPEGVTPEMAELHDSPFSGGVKVALK